MTRVEELHKQVQALSPDEREELRARLADEPDLDFELSPEWKAEIKRRIKDWESGRVTTIPWETVRDELRERIRAHKD